MSTRRNLPKSFVPEFEIRSIGFFIWEDKPRPTFIVRAEFLILGIDTLSFNTKHVSQKKDLLMYPNPIQLKKLLGRIPTIFKQFHNPFIAVPWKWQLNIIEQNLVPGASYFFPYRLDPTICDPLVIALK